MNTAKFKASKTFIKYRRELIKQSEKEFFAMQDNHPFYVYLPKVKALHEQSEQSMLDYCDKVTEWLENNLPNDAYCAFYPVMGRYAEKSNGVFFKRAEDATWFKLSLV